MRKSQKKEQAFKGEITAFLALLFVLMISLVGALIESASIQMTKNIKRADTILALESTFAEYDKEMLEAAGISVAMGNGAVIAKEAANFVTDDIDEDGIANAFRKLGLIDQCF